MSSNSSKKSANAMTRLSWTSYATAIGGLAAAGTLSTSADAGVLYHDVNPDLTKGNRNDNIYFDLDQSGSAPYALLNASNPDSDIWLRATGNENVITLIALGNAEVAGYNILKLSAGATIDNSLGGWRSGLAYFKFFGYTNYNWNNGGDGYIGLRIKDGSDYYYGWAHYSIDLASQTSTLLEFAISTTANQGILAGDAGTPVVPEPTTATIFALALGIGGAAARRRKAKAA